MKYRRLGRTGIDVSAVSFGAGPVSGWAILKDVDNQCAVIQHAIDCGINWFDTAPTYADGQSELSLGRALSACRSEQKIHLATKVRVVEEGLRDIRGYVLRSVEASLQRLKCSQIALLQLHNSVTAQRGDQPTSLTPHDVLDPAGVLSAFLELKAAKVVAHLGLTGLGDAPSIRTVIASEEFETVQTPYHMLNPSAGEVVAADFSETDYGNQFEQCRQLGMGVFAIRVFAGGALAGRKPSPHTLTTRFFPLDLYQRDLHRASSLASSEPPNSLPSKAIRFALNHPAVSSALIGFARTEEIDAAVQVIESVD
ncbi:MAG: aldo/keto reductase [Planctomycetaceae bacterium]